MVQSLCGNIVEERCLKAENPNDRAVRNVGTGAKQTAPIGGALAGEAEFVEWQLSCVVLSNKWLHGVPICRPKLCIDSLYEWLLLLRVARVHNRVGQPVGTPLPRYGPADCWIRLPFGRSYGSC